MNTLKINSKNHSYDIIVGHNIMDHTINSINWKTESITIFCEEILTEVANKLIENFKQQNKYTTSLIPVKAGEQIKTLEHIEKIIDVLIQKKISRNSTLLVIGGGAFSDFIGFVASIYQRGIPWICIPSTLLSQIDSSIGGKTAVNHKHAKNLIGSFYPPSLVICDQKLLKTLSKKEILSGLGEMIKHALLFDSNYLDEIEEFWNKGELLDSKALTPLILKSIEIKKSIVERDEKEKKGVRELLNYGHTFGHALEKYLGYDKIKHGEAILLGIKLSLLLSRKKELMNENTFNRIISFLDKLPISEIEKTINSTTFFEILKLDKKNQDNKIYFVLMKDFNNHVVKNDITNEEIKYCFEKIGVKLI